jgi:glycolate oxidase
MGDFIPLRNQGKYMRDNASFRLRNTAKCFPTPSASPGEIVGQALPRGTVFHAGDGNLHPLILYDANQPGELERAEAFGADILKLCVEVGGVLTGEHGVGVEKRDLMPVMFSKTDLDHQQRLKCAFDHKGLLNPGKVFPTLHRCAELGRIDVHAGRTAFPDLPRF